MEEFNKDYGEEQNQSPKTKQGNNGIKIIVLLMAVIAIVICFFLDGVKLIQNVETVVVEERVTLIGVIFGSSKLLGEANGIEVNIPFEGAASYLGTISFILLCLAIILILLGVIKSKKTCDLIGYVLLLVSGVLMFFLLKAGSNGVLDMTAFEGGKITSSFKDFYEGCDLGIGVYVYAIMCILGAVLGFVAGSKKD